MSEKRPRNWLKFTCLGCTIAPCLLGLCTYGFIKYRFSQTANRLPEELKKLQSLGVATVAKDLEPKTAVLPDDNAATDYSVVAILGKAVQQKKGYGLSSFILNSYVGQPENRADAVSEIDSLSGYFSSLAKGTSKPRCWFNRDYTQGFKVVFPEFADMKQMAKFLGGKARVLIEDQNYLEALDCIRQQRVIANHLKDEPTVIGMLVSIAIESMTFANLERLLIAIENNPPMLEKTLKMLEANPVEINLRRAMEGEFVMGRYSIQILRSWKDLGSNSDADSLTRTMDRFTLEDPGFRAMLEARFASTWREAFEGFPKGATNWNAYDEVFKSLEKKVGDDNSLENKFNQIMFPSFTQVGESYGMLQARERLVKLATKLLLARKSGLPKNLVGFGDLGIDPLAGKPMGYFRQGKGFKVWSIGQNLYDDGGLKFVSGVTKISARDCDIVLGFDMGFPSPIVKPIQLPRITGGPGSSGPAPGSPPPGSID